MVKSIPTSWSSSDTKIKKLFQFGSFPEAISFMVEVSFYCQSQDHHPEWSNVYDKISVELTTHSEGHVTDKDVSLAEFMDAVYNKYSRVK